MFSRFVIGTFYRKDMFQKAGIDPSTLTTWDRFIEAAQKVTEKDASGNVVHWGYLQAFPTDGANMPVMGNVMLDLQGSLFGDKAAATWATEAGLKGMNLQLDFIRKYGISPEVAMSMNDEDMYDAFSAGRAAMIHGGINRLPAAQEKLGAENVGYLRTPSFTEGKYSPAETGGWASGVWAKSKNLEMAGKWLEYMASPEADKLWVMEAGMVPLRQSTIDNNQDFFTRPDKDYLVTAFEELKTAWLPPEGVAGGFNDDLDRAAQQVFVNGADPKEALEKAEKAYDRRR
jgi:ABC-type glycerol-3-phosphate transport system substrate-binding protein